GSYEGFGLAANAGVLFVIGVRQHADRSQRHAQMVATLPRGPSTTTASARRALLRSGSLMTTQEVALDGQREVAFRSSARRPGPLGLILEGWTDIWSRRRLIGYLARADLKKKGADTLFGNLWWIIDPLLQMLV